MKYWCKGATGEFSMATFHNDMFAYYSYVEVLCPIRPLPDDDFFIEINGKKSRYHVMTAKFEDTNYHLTLVNDNVYKILTTPTKQFTGDADVKTLVQSKMGYPYYSTVATESTHWMLPPLKLVTFMKNVVPYVKVANGGGVVMFVDSMGVLNLIDLHKLFQTSKPSIVQGGVTADESDIEWYLHYAGTVNINSHTHEKVIKDSVVIDKNGPTASYFGSFNVESREAQIKQACWNEYYCAYYTSRKVTVGVVPGAVLPVGTMVVLNNNPAKLMVASTTLTVQSDTPNAYSTMTLVGCHK